ncbi:sialin-like [Branchiostoma lanceolatum]|uniref:sialin-like n=1 Tax=Branchiostoma lanceolatum TaxID=7740 RepID=UPI003451EB0F
MSIEKSAMKELRGGENDGETPAHGNKKKKSCFPIADRIPARYILTALFFFGIVALQTTRHGFSVAIVVMTNTSSSATAVNQTAIYQNCPRSGPMNVSAQRAGGDRDQGELFEWSQSIKGTLLGAYFYGYIITQVAGGVLEQRFGGKVVFGTSLLLAAVLNALGPVAARSSAWAMFAVRFCLGLVTGVSLPSMYGVWGRWAPPTERTRLLAFCYIALSLGGVITFPLASNLADEYGWPAVFYIPGSFVAVWLLAWVLLAYDSPAKHPRILEEEQEYIEDGIGMKTQQRLPVPWREVLTSLPVWALIVGQFSSLWGTYLLLTQMPNYMKNVLGFNIRTNGLLSALPPLLAMISMMLSSFLADYLITRGTIPKVWIRRSFVITGFTGMVICGIVLANLSGCDPAAAVALLCLLQAFSGLTNAGFRAVHIEFAPRFSGVTFSLANTAGTLPGIVAPLLVGFIVENDPTIAGWSKIFYIGAAIQAVGCVFTVVFMRTDVQPWARGKGDVEAKNTGSAKYKNTLPANENAEMTAEKLLEQETNM